MTKTENDKEMEQRIKNCSKIANKIVRYIQKEVKTLSVMGENDPFLVQDMSVAYAFGILKLMFHKAMIENNQPCEWSDLKDSCHKAIDIAFEHVENQFIKPKEVIAQ